MDKVVRAFIPICIGLTTSSRQFAWLEDWPAFLQQLGCPSTSRDLCGIVNYNDSLQGDIITSEVVWFHHMWRITIQLLWLDANKI